jgi:pumilio RNA-binding family
MLMKISFWKEIWYILECILQIAKCKDQQNARYIQKIFQEADFDRRAHMFQKLEKGTLVLSKDVFGNYVIQNLLEFGTQPQRLKILQNVLNSAISLSLHSYGCRVVQKALEIFQNDTKEFNSLFEFIKPKVRELVIDGNGNHVVQKVIQLREKEVAGWV